MFEELFLEKVADYVKISDKICEKSTKVKKIQEDKQDSIPSPSS